MISALRNVPSSSTDFYRNRPPNVERGLASSLRRGRLIFCHGLRANYLHYLLKTFSINPFQGQYPNMPVRINATPINPITQRKIPSIEKAKMIKMIPMIYRKIASALLTFFVLTTDSIFHSHLPMM